MNLEELKVESLDKETLSKTEGGMWFLVGLLLGDIICNPGDFGKGLRDSAK